MKPIDTGFLLKEAMDQYHAKAIEFLSSHRLADAGQIRSTGSDPSMPLCLSTIAIAPQGRSWHAPKMHTTFELPGIARPSSIEPGDQALLP